MRAVADLPRARCLVLAGSIMGGDITAAVRELREHGVPVIALNMAGSVTDAADLVVSDPVQAGTMAVMAIADTAQFDLARQRGRRTTCGCALRHGRPSWPKLSPSQAAWRYGCPYLRTIAVAVVRREQVTAAA